MWKKDKASKKCGTISKGLIHVIGKEEKNKAEEILQEIIAKYFPKWMKDNKPQIQEAQRIPSGITWHVVVKLVKTKDMEKIWKAARKNLKFVY